MDLESSKMSTLIHGIKFTDLIWYPFAFEKKKDLSPEHLKIKSLDKRKVVVVCMVVILVIRHGFPPPSYQCFL